MATNTKWLLTRTMNLGFCRETFKAGSVIVELDDSLLINGREYKDNRDMEILKRQMLKNPEDAWIIPYTEEDEQNLLTNGKTDAVVRKRPPTDHSMPVISSDDDLIEAIDVSNTQISVINERKKAEAKRVAKEGKLEIIPDHEEIEERISRIANKSDAAALAERVALKSGGIQKMSVVHDDSLGAQYDSRKNPSLNAGAVIPAKHYTPAKTQEVLPVAEPEGEARMFGIESAIKKIISEHFGHLSSLAESVKMFTGLGEKMKEFEASLKKIVDFVVDCREDLKEIAPLIEKFKELGDMKDRISALFDRIGKIEASLDTVASFIDGFRADVKTDDAPTASSADSKKPTVSTIKTESPKVKRGRPPKGKK